ncbi:MAG: monoheme cytochrome SoxX [Thiobacillus sp.]|nr:monoheme cytochrome SoxX [Thiobacillus sp.]
MFDRRLILLATPRQIGVLDWRPGRMHWLGEYLPTTEGLAAFRALLTRHAQLPTRLVVDTVDEDYRSEILPHVQGRAREELLARKLKQVFRNARFTGAWRQGRESSGRRDDRYLFAALTDADWLTPWLSALDAARVPLAGIAPLALAYQHLLATLRIQEPHVLLAYRLNQRLRLSYYQNGLLRFSRLIGGETAAPATGNSADEIAKTQLYLTGQRILPREARLHVVLFDPAGQLDSAQAQLNADPAFSTRLVDLPTLAAALRIPDDFLAATPGLAPLAALAGQPLLLNLAPAELLHAHTLFRWRRGLHLAAGSLAFAGLALTGALWLHSRSQLDEAAEIETRAYRIDAAHAALVKQFPTLATRPGDLARTLDLSAQLQRPPFDIAAQYHRLGGALTDHPDIILRSLTFEAAGDARAGITLEAQLDRFDGNYRTAMARIDSFVARLAAQPGVHRVEKRESPVDTAPTATLRGETLRESDPDATRFTLYIEADPR